MSHIVRKSANHVFVSGWFWHYEGQNANGIVTATNAKSMAFSGISGSGSA
jgi:hypothetical protein